MRPRFALTLAAALAALTACEETSLPPGSEIGDGTWGGEAAGLIVLEGAAHLHIGCTFGNFAAPIPLDDEGRFEVEGSYMLRAYPVAIGPTLPAEFSGRVRGKELTLGVVVNDTVQGKEVALGPVTLVLGREPRMGPCPICLRPPTTVVAP